MTKYILSVMLITGSFFCSQGYCQANNDTSLAATVRVLQRKLSLQDGQAKAVLSFVKKQRNQSDSLSSNKTLLLEDRGKELVKIQNQYEQQLKGILTKEQWNQYKEIEAVNREAFIKRMKDKKIEFKELPRNNG